MISRLVASRHFSKLSDRRGAAAFFLAAAALLAVIALGVGQSAAQTSASGMTPTSPLGADFGQTLGSSPIGMPSAGGIGATSPLGAGFGQSLGNNSQTTPVPFTDVANPGPCTSGGPGAAALSPFDGGGLSQTSGGLSPTTDFTTSGIGAASTASAPCNSVSSSSGVTGSLNSANSAAAPSASAPSAALAVSSGLGSSIPATASTSPNTTGLGVTALGTSGLGTTGLGMTGLGSSQSASSKTTLSTLSLGSTPCFDVSRMGIGTGSTNSATSDLSGMNGTVQDSAQMLGGSGPDPAESLGGVAHAPSQPCMTGE
jgi:hypothetical protein